MTSWHKDYFSIHPDVAQALNEGTPIVALESTVITHGLPYPDNGELAKSMEAEVRTRGCIPAIIAILDGMICIGIDEAKLERLAQGKGMLKVSSRGIAAAVAKQQSGGTTVAGTLVIAREAGIRVFATGGIGGVHREAPFDVSADLAEMGRSKLVVVCAGAKAILDIEATLEVLETYSIPVIGYKTDEFPAFYSVSSGMGVSVRADSAKEVAKLANIHWDLGMPSAILLAVPLPKENALRTEVVEAAIHTALDEAHQTNIHGQAVTPFLLRRVSELTGGASLQANLALLRNNARVAAEVASYFPRRLS